MRFTTKLLPSQTKNLGIITLSNPKALNALTRDMIDCFEDLLSKEWNICAAANNSVLKAILILGSKETKRPTFCAGGDVKTIYELGKQQHSQNSTTQTPGSDDSPPPPPPPRAEDFFYHEYKVNYMIATSKIPIISFWDGVVMGGGVGISIHGKYRIATENTLFAMPECGIGLFPDVGSMWWMNQLLHNKPVANYLALTGQRIYPADLIYTGLATHYVPSNQLDNLQTALADATEQQSSGGDEDFVGNVLHSFHETIPTDECFLATNKDNIDKTFDGQTVEEILSNLQKAGDDDVFCQSALQTLQKMSPTSMKITLEGLARGSRLASIGEDLQMEYRMAKACMRPGSDFFEGVRALIIDKDQTPQWNPSTIQDITNEQVDEFFSPIGDDKEWQIPSSSPKL